MRRLLFTATMIMLVTVPALLFLTYGLKGGMPWDFSLVYVSETTPGPLGFLYLYDKLRIYTNVFYHLGYHASRLAGVDGSWSGYHGVYAALWIAKGVLVYWLCRLLDLNQIIASLAAGIALMHGSDTSIGHVGQTNQYGVAFWCLLSICLFAYFFRSRSVLAVAMAAVASHLALWSHEASLFGLLMAPALLCVLFWQQVDRWRIAGALIATLPPIVYAALMFNRLVLNPSGASFQEAVTRPKFDFAIVAADYLSLIKGLYWPPLWLSTKVAASDWERLAEAAMTWGSFVVALGIIAIFAVVVGVAAARLSTDDKPARLAATALVMLMLSVVFVAPFLALPGGGGYWRTQIVAAPYASVFVTTALWLLVYRIPLVRGFAVGAAAFVLVITGFIANAARYDHWNREWARLTAPVARMLAAAPALKPNTILLLQGAPMGALWGSNFWFDLIVRIAYPHVRVTGAFTYTGDPSDAKTIAMLKQNSGELVQLPDGRKMLTPHMFSFTVDGSKVHSERPGPLFQTGTIDQLVVLRWTPSGPFEVVDNASEIDMASTPDADRYKPRERIEPDISPIARRRFLVEP